MRRVLALLVIVPVVLAFGCAASNRTRDLEFELRKTESERDTLNQRLSATEARAQELQRRMEAEQERATTDRAAVSSLTAQVNRLTATNEQLQGLLKQLEARPLARPDVPLSPLPEAADTALAAFAQRNADRVTYDRERGAITFANDRLFDAGSDDLRAEAKPLMNELATALAQAPAEEFDIVVIGHADNSPITKPETLAKHPTNWHLSVHRAISVQQALIQAGMPAERFGVMGYAHFRPVGSDPARNRRVEVFLVRKGAVQSFAPVKPARR